VSREVWFFFEAIFGGKGGERVGLYLYFVTCVLGNGVCGVALRVFAYFIGYIIRRDVEGEVYLHRN